MSSLLILGGSGILGSEIIQAAEKLGLDYVAPRSSDLDIRDNLAVEEFVSNFKPSWVINCAAWTNVDEAENSPEQANQLNFKAVVNLADAAKKTKSALVHFSTDYVFDGNSPSAYEVSDSTNPINQYGISKLRGERALADSQMDSAYVVRTAWLYGVGGKNFVKTMARKALKGESVQVVNDQLGSPTSARDLARATLELISKKPTPGIYHYVNQGSCTWFEFAEAIYELVGSNQDLVSPMKSDDLQLKAKRPANSLLSTKKWEDSDLGKIENWKKSLELLMPEILDEVEKESQI
jgi:dTDP-4-dehydrorhamnose reductase